MTTATKTKTKTESKAEPFVKWVGGKRQMLDQYEEFFPENYNTYHEPMVGGGAVFFHLQPEKSIINDKNKILVILYEAIRDNVDEIINQLKDLKKKHSKEFYHETLRPNFNEIKTNYLETPKDEIPKEDKIELSANFIYLNKTCFNGLYRVNQSGEFNVPCGKYKNPTICDEENLRNVNKVLQGTKVYCEDFRDIAEKVEKNDFVYIDPPYDPISDTSDFTGYTSDGFGKKDQEDLADTFRKLSERGAKVMLSNSNTDFINDLYSDFNIHGMQANRYVNSDSDKRGKIKEVLITNY
ncbi:MAG: DNA adenine methylase [Candidatus Magasanikbacteria bacterium]